MSLELGGKSPNIVCKDADVEACIPGVAGAIFFNQGQCCCAGSRLFVEKSIFDKVVEGVAADARKIKVGPGMDPATQMGPLVSDEQQLRVLGYLEAGFSEGAKAVVGGRKLGNKGYFVEPTVLVEVLPMANASIYRIATELRAARCGSHCCKIFGATPLMSVDS